MRTLWGRLKAIPKAASQQIVSTLISHHDRASTHLPTQSVPGKYQNLPSLSHFIASKTIKELLRWSSFDSLSLQDYECGLWFSKREEDDLQRAVSPSVNTVINAGKPGSHACSACRWSVHFVMAEFQRFCKAAWGFASVCESWDLCVRWEWFTWARDHRLIDMREPQGRACRWSWEIPGAAGNSSY